MIIGLQKAALIRHGELRYRDSRSGADQHLPLTKRECANHRG